ncbi:MAG: DUF86 domain-containing protein [Bacteroidetes bacterium]|nr:DUF86 domain-containing protein [Bacteroidota bacterium]
MHKDNFVYIGHILERAERILQFMEGMDESAFCNDEKTKSAVIREFEVIGEASKRISDDFKTLHPALPWKEMAGMRDKIIHDYEGVNPFRLWDTAKSNLPALISELKKIIPAQ